MNSLNLINRIESESGMAHFDDVFFVKNLINRIESHYLPFFVTLVFYIGI